MIFVSFLQSSGIFPCFFIFYFQFFFLISLVHDLLVPLVFFFAFCASRIFLVFIRFVGQAGYDPVVGPQPSEKQRQGYKKKQRKKEENTISIDCPIIEFTAPAKN